MKTVLHVGCGGAPLPEWLSHYAETRLDIDEDHNPDIVGDMVNLGDVGTFDMIYCNHALEHLFPHDVATTLKGFHNALNDGGAVVVFVPDLEDVFATDRPLFDSPAGPIAGLDLIYGYRKMLKEKPYMAHKTGFICRTLHAALTDAGFSNVSVSRLSDYALMGAAVK